jgi:hypothetical protein
LLFQRLSAPIRRVEFTIHPPDDELEFGTDEAPRLLGQACALLGPQHDIGRFEELVEQNALEAAWDALAEAGKSAAPDGFWPLMALGAGHLGSARRQHQAESQPGRLQGDFNGVFGELLCLSHGETCRDEAGADVCLSPGMAAIVFENDPDIDGAPDALIATGIVEPAPEWLSCKGSKWVLRINALGVRHLSDG